MIESGAEHLVHGCR